MSQMLIELSDSMLVVKPSEINSFYKIISDFFHCYQIIIQERCPNENVTFWLYNKQVYGYQLKENELITLQEAPFIPDQRIIFLIHGFTGNRECSPNLQIKPKLIKKGYNVISVDYENVAKFPCYLQAVENSKTIARCLADFIETLSTIKIKDKSFSLEDIHLIGFSLGGQIAGKTGAYLKASGKMLSRITGLDVAGPLFYGPTTYLNKNCAKFVDCIHTCSGRLGKLFPIGHVDFYVNSLIHQNGCDFWNFSCDHGRAPELYAESIDSEVGFYGVNFSGDFELMGHNASTRSNGIYHVETNAKSPFAKESKKINKNNLD
ncbi:phospholipase A1-like [Onthophagus taurus]|uniref:phospholipase A1-like n=1 Tax=Onthophagus taurus TaxID=166361 RepID=UPI0039BE1318